MAFTIRNLKIRNQILLLIVPPLFILFCSVGIAAFAYWSISSGNLASARSSERVARNQSFWSHAAQIYRLIDRYVVAHQDTGLTHFDEYAAGARSDLITLSSLEAADPDHAQEVADMRTQFESFLSIWAKPTLALARSGGTYDSDAVMKDGQQRLSAMGTAGYKLRKEDETQSGSDLQHAQGRMWQMLVVVISVAVVLAALLILLEELWSRQIVAPVMQIVRASEQVGHGDFSPALPSPSDNEIGILSRSFARMTAALQLQRHEMASLNRFSQAVAQCTSETEVYDLVLHALKERFRPTQIIIFKLQKPESFLEAVASLAPLPKEANARPVIEEPHDCKAVRAGSSFIVNDVRVHALCPTKFALPAEGSYFCGPLIAGGIVIGSVRMQAAAHVMTDERLRLLESYLSGAASALSNLQNLSGLREQANFDALTGLYNRRFVQDFARKQLAIARRNRQSMGVLMLDLDHFKSFNDNYGHETGDLVLQHFSKAVGNALRDANLLARYGGEEFVVVIAETSTEACVLVAERLREAVMTMLVPSEQPLPQVTVSIGVACFPEHGETLEDLVQASDKAMYESKRAGRNRVTVASIHDAGPTDASAA